MYGQQLQAPQYFCGTDIAIEVNLTDNSQPVDYNDYYLKVTLAGNGLGLIWVGYLNYGLFIVEDQVTIRIPASITAQLDSGIYYATVLGQTKQHPQHIAVLFEQTLSLQELRGGISSPLIQPALSNPPPPPINPYLNAPADAYMPIDYFSI